MPEFAAAERAGSGAAASGRWSLPATELLLLPALVLMLVGVLTPAAELFPNQFDVGLYFQNAGALAGGQWPYRDFAFEYPPLALVPMVVPFLAWPFGAPTFETYQWLFLAWEGILLTALVVVVGRIADHVPIAGLGAVGLHRPNAVTTRLVLLTIVAAPSLAWRFDLFPALLSAVALLAAVKGRAAVAGGSIGLGVLAKLYPAVLVPAILLPWLMARDRGRTIRFAVAATATVAIVVVPLVLVVGDRALSPLRYQGARGLQLESVGAGIVLLDALVRGVKVSLDFNFGAVHVAGAGARAVLAMLPWLTLVGFGLLLGLSATLLRREKDRRGGVDPRTLVRIAAASLVLLIVVNKVFSVQYVVWLVPLAALLPRGQFLLVALIAAVSVGIHPLNYEHLIDQEAPLVVLLNLRNGLVVGLLAWLVASLVLLRPREGGVARPAGLEPTTFRSAT